MQISKIYSLKCFIALAFILALFYVSPAQAIVIVAGKIDHFTLILSDVIVAGEPFSVKIIARDKFDNTIINYNEVGANVEIETIGKGKITPEMISAQEFKDGVAKVFFIYDQAETFTIEVRTKLELKAKPEVMARKTITAHPAQETKVVTAPEKETIRKPPLIKELELTNERLDAAIKIKTNLEEKLMQLVKTLEQREKENLDLKTALSEINSAREDLSDRLAEHKTMLTQAEAKLVALEEKLKEAFDTKAKLTQAEAKLVALEEKLKEAFDTKAKLAHIESKLQEVSKVKVSLEERLSQLSKSLEERDRENLNLKSRLKEVTSEKEDLQGQLISTKSFLTQTQAKINQLRELNSSLEEALKRGEQEERYSREIFAPQPLDVQEWKEELPSFNEYTVEIYSGGEACAILPLGKNDGLKKGMSFTVYNVNEEAIGQIKVTEVYEYTSIAEIKKTIGSHKIRTGDIVRLRQ